MVPPGSVAEIPQPRLSKEGVVLRPWTADDTGAVVDAYTDVDIQRWHFRHLDPAEAREWIEAWSRGWAAETDAGWAVCTGTETDAAGSVALRNLSLQFGLGSISYWIRPAYRRRGLATAASRTVAAWALDVLGLHRLEIRHSVHNSESCGVALNADFPVEGTMRSALRHADGWHDVHVHARLGSP